MSMRVQFNMELVNEVYRPEFLSYDKRVNIFYGGAGSGKSYFVIQKMIMKSMKFTGRRTLVIRKVSNTIRDSIFADFISILGDWGLLNNCRVNKSNMEIELPNGSIFLFKGIDDPEKIKSISRIDDIVIEEATDIHPDDFAQLSKRLRSQRPHNQIHLMFNPIGKFNWVYPKWFAESSVVPDNTKILHTTYKDNINNLPDDFMEEMENDIHTNPAFYRVYTLGEFATLEELVFTNVSTDNFDHHELMAKNDKLELMLGLDFGYSHDPTAFIASLYDKENKKIYVFEEFYEKGMHNDEIANKIISMGYGKERLLAESASPKDVDDLVRQGLRKTVGVKKGPGSIMNGVQFIQQHEIIVHESCTNTLEELANYAWKRNKAGEYMNEPIDKYNHLMDALRYSLSEVNDKGTKKVQSFDRRLLGF